jgi:hypothetical protein
MGPGHLAEQHRHELPPTRKPPRVALSWVSVTACWNSIRGKIWSSWLKMLQNFIGCPPVSTGLKVANLLTPIESKHSPFVVESEAQVGQE